MIHVPPELNRMLLETDDLVTRIMLLKEKKRMTMRDLHHLAVLKTELLKICPPERYAWVDGLPVVDILKTLHLHQTEKETSL
jgi:hypothetical protein